jgi:hypothetical protein
VRKSATTIAAAVVGVLVIAGGATAASNYIITNIHQIKPNVLSKLQPRLRYGDVAGPVQTMCPSGTDTTGQCEVAASDARCPRGAVMGGGWTGGSNPSGDQTIGYNGPDNDGMGWSVVVANLGPSSATVQAIAICLAQGNLARDAGVSVPALVKAEMQREVAAMLSR